VVDGSSGGIVGGVVDGRGLEPPVVVASVLREQERVQVKSEKEKNRY